MKKTICYEGEIFEDRDMFSIIENAENYHSALCVFAQWLRTEYKHGDREAVPVEELHTKFYEILGNGNVTLDV